MIQGCTSDAGKSFVVTGLARLLTRKGVDVAPFKPQNMANNSAVTIDGGEIGRAQAVQAQAAKIEPHTDMNPVLLKPNTDTGAQVVVQGKAVANMGARDYHAYKSVVRDAVLDSYHRLAKQYDLVLVEGAGSPAEINLRDNDIANMGFAEAVDCPVWLVADIDRGGVFAHLLGTLELLSNSERNRVQGLIINRFRGDVKLLESGIDWLEEKTAKPVIGVLPFLQNLHLEAEDSAALARNIEEEKSDGAFHVVVPKLPRIANHTDLDPLALHPQVKVIWVTLGERPPPCDLIVLPGSKSTRPDLKRLRQHGWDEYIAHHLRYGGKVIGVCGGYQMLGTRLHDQQGFEGEAGSSDGFGYLDVETQVEPAKQLKQVSGKLMLDDGCELTGYEIHMGVTRGRGLEKPFAELQSESGRRFDGAVSDDDRVLGTYLHGVFEHPDARDALLRWAGLAVRPSVDYRALRDAEIDRLADMLDQHIDEKFLSAFL